MIGRKVLDTRLHSLLNDPVVCHVIRALLVDSGEASAANVAVCIKLPEAEVLLAVQALRDFNFLEQSEPLKLCIDSEAWPIVDRAILNFELALVQERCVTTNLFAAEKIQAIDELAEQIAFARRDVRSRDSRFASS